MGVGCLSIANWLHPHCMRVPGVFFKRFKIKSLGASQTFGYQPNPDPKRPSSPGDFRVVGQFRLRDYTGKWTEISAISHDGLSDPDYSRLARHSATIQMLR